MLAELQALVGGFIEVVHGLGASWLVLNEDGKGLELPPNILATAELHAAGGAPWDFVAGDVLLADSVEIGAS